MDNMQEKNTSTNTHININTNTNINLDRRPLVEVSRTFNAPIDDVWRAWSDPELIKQWWGPEGHSAPEAKIEFRVGGKYTFAMKDPDGKVIWSSGVYKEIIPHKKIVTSDFFSDELGREISPDQVGMPGDWGDELQITITFKGLQPNQTEMLIRHEGIPKDMHDECVEGWSSSMNKLQKLVEKH